MVRSSLPCPRVMRRHMLDFSSIARIWRQIGSSAMSDQGGALITASKSWMPPSFASMKARCASLSSYQAVGTSWRKGGWLKTISDSQCSPSATTRDTSIRS